MSLCKLIHVSVWCVCDGYSEQFNGGLIKHAKQNERFKHINGGAGISDFKQVLRLALGVFVEAWNQYINRKVIYRSKLHTSRISDID